MTNPGFLTSTITDTNPGLTSVSAVRGTADEPRVRDQHYHGYEPRVHFDLPWDM
jgi:hypothetical protein